MNLKNITFLDSVFISLFSMIIVFFVLLIISYIVDYVAFFIVSSRKKGVLNGKKI